MKLFNAFLACLTISSAAHAEIIATFVQDEPLFGTGNNTWALQVTTDTDWQTGKIDIQLSSGQLFDRQDGFPPGPRPTFSGQNDSGVFGKGFLGPTIAPGTVQSSTRFSASWGTIAPDDTGTFYIGAFSFSNDANGTVSGRVVAQNPDDPINGFIFNLENWAVVNGVVTQVGTGPSWNLAPGETIDLSDKFADFSDLLADALMVTGATITGEPAINNPVFTVPAWDGSSVDLGILRTLAIQQPPGVQMGTLTVPTDMGEFQWTVSAAVPEPSTFALAGLALVGLIGYARCK